MKKIIILLIMVIQTGCVHYGESKDYVHCKQAILAAKAFFLTNNCIETLTTSKKTDCLYALNIITTGKEYCKEEYGGYIQFTEFP